MLFNFLLSALKCLRIRQKELYGDRYDIGGDERLLGCRTLHNKPICTGTIVTAGSNTCAQAVSRSKREREGLFVKSAHSVVDCNI